MSRTSGKNDSAIGAESLILLMSFLVLPLIVRVPSVCCTEEYTYYGVVPDRLYLYRPEHRTNGWSYVITGWELDKESVRTTGLVAMVAFEDDTNLQVYTLEDGVWILRTQFSLNTMDKYFVPLPNGTIFKVVSNHQSSTLLLNGISGEGVPGAEDLEGPVPQTFYTTPEGSYVGKVFMFVASQGLLGEPYHIFALEDAEVTITREDGARQSFNLRANTHKQLGLKAFAAYKVESTGGIMIQSGGPGSQSFFVPSAEGGFVGERFYSCSAVSYETREEYGFMICSPKEAKVTVWNLEFRRVIQEVEIEAGEIVSVKPKTEGDQQVIAVESDNPITFSFIHGGPITSYGAAVTYIGVKPDEETLFYLPLDSIVHAYVFAYENAQVRIDDVPLSVDADSFFLLTTGGFHRILSDRNLVIQVIHWPLTPENQGILSFGVAVPCIQTVDVTPDIAVTPIAIEEGFPIAYAIAGALVAVVAAAVLIAVKRRVKH